MQTKLYLTKMDQSLLFVVLQKLKLHGVIHIHTYLPITLVTIVCKLWQKLIHKIHYNVCISFFNFLIV
jgi:hypothetical protein